MPLLLFRWLSNAIFNLALCRMQHANVPSTLPAHQMWITRHYVRFDGNVWLVLMCSCLSQYKPDEFCIPHERFRRDHGYVTQRLAAGRWSVRIRSTSLASNSSWTPHVYFDITKPVGQFVFRVFFSCNIVCRVLIEAPSTPPQF